jgi:uncharacterized protein
MKTAECDIVMVPGFSNSGEQHWQTRWQSRLATARRVEMPDWEKPVLSDWTAAIVKSAALSTRPVILMAHSLGVLAVVHAASQLPKTVKGAFLVAPPSETAVLDIANIDIKFAHVPRDPLPFPSVLIASNSDPYCPILEAEEWAYAWGSAFTDAGDAGHLNMESGHGPWPEGLMRFASFLAKI